MKKLLQQQWQSTMRQIALKIYTFPSLPARVLRDDMQQWNARSRATTWSRQKRWIYRNLQHPPQVNELVNKKCIYRHTYVAMHICIWWHVAHLRLKFNSAASNTLHQRAPQSLHSPTRAGYTPYTTRCSCCVVSLTIAIFRRLTTVCEK